MEEPAVFLALLAEVAQPETFSELVIAVVGGPSGLF